MDATPQLRIALVTVNAHGHFRSLFGLGSRLVEHGGDNVTVLLTLACSAVAELPEKEYPAIPVHRILLPNDIPKGGLHQMAYVDEHENEIVESAIQMFIKERINVVMYDPFASWGHVAALAVNAKSYLVCTSPLNCYYLWLKAECFVQEPRDTPTVYIPGVGEVSRFAMPDTKMMSTFFVRATERLPQVTGYICNDSPVQKEVYELVDSFQDIWRQRNPMTSTGGVHLLGYFADLPAVIDQPETPELKWLNQQEPNSVIFIALGSWCPIAMADVVELAEGLAASGSKFIWALRDPVPETLSIPPPHAPSDYKARQTSVEIQSNGLPVGFQERLEGRGLVLRWVNQPAVLSHPAIKTFVTHCGWNSLTEAIRLCPRPLALLPLMAEQDLNAHVVEKVWGVGKRLWGLPPFRQLDRVAVAQTLNEIGSDTEMARKAAQLHQDQNTTEGKMAPAWKQLLSELSM